MLFQVFVLLAILLITSYLATQGWLSATLVFVSATFASILAGGLYEPVGTMLSYSPNYSRGTAFLGVFLISFAALRITADKVVKDNVTLQVWVDRAGGGVLGLLAALVVTGTLVIGVCMMPLGESLMGESVGWNRYPGGLRDKESKLWLNPDGFVTWIYEMSLGRSMGGAYGGDPTFAQAHPDLGTELWGLRHKVQISSEFTMLPSLLEKPKAWKSEDKNSEGKYVVRMSVRKRLKEGPISEDKDHNFRATNSQVRLIAINDSTGDARQYYPEGYLEKGTTYIPLGNALPDFAYIQEEYTDAGKDEGSGERVMVDYVFNVDPGYEKMYLEVKGLARQSVEVLAAAEKAHESFYPPQTWKKNQFRMTVDAHDATKVIPGLQVWVAPFAIPKKPVEGMIVDMAEVLEQNTKAAQEMVKSPAIPTSTELKGQTDNARNARLGPDTDEFSFNGVIVPAIFWSSLEPTGSGAGNAARARDALDIKLKPILKDLAKATPLSTNNKGATEEILLRANSYCLVAWYYDDKNTLYVWTASFRAEAKKNVKYTLTTEKEAVKKSGDDLEITPNFVWPRR